MSTISNAVLNRLIAYNYTSENKKRMSALFHTMFRYLFVLAIVAMVVLLAALNFGITDASVRPLIFHSSDKGKWMYR